MTILPTHSRAAVFHAVGQPLTPEYFPLPQLQGSEALVRVCCATVCGLDIYPMKTFVKLGDTPNDVAEAHAAGMWAVSVVRSGNEVGLRQVTSGHFS